MASQGQPSFVLCLIRAIAIFIICCIHATRTFFSLIFCGWLCNIGHFFYTKSRKFKPACLQGWNDKYIDLKNVRMHYVEYGEPTKPLMLFVHGFPEFFYCWRNQIKYFSQKDYHVVAVDLRGYGETSRPRGYSNYDLADVAGDLIELIPRLGHKKCILIGHDWGGATSWRLAMLRPDLIERMIVLNIYHPKVFSELLATPQQRKKSWYFFLFQFSCVTRMYLKNQDYKYLENVYRSKESGLINQKNFTDEDLEAFKYSFSRPGAIEAITNYNKSALRHFRPPVMSSDLIQPKTLIIFGEQDAALSLEGAKMSLKLCRDAQLQAIPNASHWVQQDTPEIVNQCIEEFIADLKIENV